MKLFPIVLLVAFKVKRRRKVGLGFVLVRIGSLKWVMFRFDCDAYTSGLVPFPTLVHGTSSRLDQDYHSVSRYLSCSINITYPIIHTHLNLPHPSVPINIGP